MLAPYSPPCGRQLLINFDPNRATGFGAHWHTSGDTMGVISKETLRAVGETVATTLRGDI